MYTQQPDGKWAPGGLTGMSVYTHWNISVKTLVFCHFLHREANAAKVLVQSWVLLRGWPYNDWPCLAELGSSVAQTNISLDISAKMCLKETWTSIFLATLFTTTRTWSQPRCPSTDEWIMECVINIRDFYSSVRNYEISRELDGSGKYYISEVSQTQKDEACLPSLICGSKLITFIRK